MKNKKGVTTKALVTWIVLIVSFIILLLLFFRLDLGKETEQDTCHYSVVARATAISSTNLLKEAIPLNCKTQYICISEDGTCEKLTSPEIEKVKTKEEIYEVLANQLSECWWMFGEGKIDYVGKELLANNLYCSLCSQIAFDDSLMNIEELESGEINRYNFYEYLAKTEMSSEEVTYWDYLYGENSPEEISATISSGTTNLENTDTIATMCNSLCETEDVSFCYSQTVLTPSDGSTIAGSCYALSKGNYGINECTKLPCGDNGLNEKLTITQAVTSYEFGNINFDNQYYTMMGIVSKTSLTPWMAAVGGGIVGITVGAFTGGAGLVALATAGISGVGTYIGQVSEGESEQQYLRPTIIEASDDFEKLKCKDVNTIA